MDTNMNNIFSPISNEEIIAAHKALYGKLPSTKHSIAVERTVTKGKKRKKQTTPPIKTNNVIPEYASTFAKIFLDNVETIAPILRLYLKKSVTRVAFCDAVDIAMACSRTFPPNIGYVAKYVIKYVKEKHISNDYDKFIECANKLVYVTNGLSAAEFRKWYGLWSKGTYITRNTKLVWSADRFELCCKLVDCLDTQAGRKIIAKADVNEMKRLNNLFKDHSKYVSRSSSNDDILDKLLAIKYDT